jgi:hypothetical protein
MKRLLMKQLIQLLFLLLPLLIFGQKRDTLIGMRIYYDNDFFNYRGEGTDREYTAGTKIDFYYLKSSKRRFIDRFLIELSGRKDNLYGWGIAQLMFTPNNIASSAIVYGDRPYAGLLYLNHSLVSSDDEKKQKITTELDLGVIGKYSLAGQTQILIHKLIHYQVPNGWNNQIAPDFILNYFIQYDELIVQPSENLEIIGRIESNMGTWQNTIGLGVTLRVGQFNSYFTNYENPGLKEPEHKSYPNYKKFQFYFFMRPIFRAVMDNATLQGGFFTHDNSPYTLTKDQITNSHIEFDYGFVIAKNRLGFSFSEKLRTEEFKNGVNQQVGNFTFYIGF